MSELGGVERRHGRGRGDRAGQPPVVGPRGRGLPARARGLPRHPGLSPTSSGARKGCARPTRGCWARSTAVACSRSAAALRSARAGCGRREPRSSRWTCPLAQLRESQRIDRAAGDDLVPLVQADAARLPLSDASVDLACSAYGALPFVADSAAVQAEVARVLRPGGRWVFSVTHPIRWALPDDPGREGLTVTSSYFDRTPYVELDGTGARHLRRAPPHAGRPGARDPRRRAAAGRPGRAGVAGGEHPGLGRVEPAAGAAVPGTAIFVCRRP